MRLLRQVGVVVEGVVVEGAVHGAAGAAPFGIPLAFHWHCTVFHWYFTGILLVFYWYSTAAVPLAFYHGDCSFTDHCSRASFAPLRCVPNT